MANAGKTMLWPVVIAATILAGCASGPPPTSLGAEDIATAEESGSLEALYGQIDSELAIEGQSATNLQKLQGMKEEVAEKLARALDAEIRRETAAADRFMEWLPQEFIQNQRRRGEKMSAWSATLYETLDAELVAELDATLAAIAEREATLATLGPQMAADQLRILDELAQLAGEESATADELRVQSLKIRTDLATHADEALAAGNHGEARRLLLILLEINPLDLSLNQKLALANARVFEEQFAEAVANGRSDEAYELVVAIANDSNFEGIRSQLIISREELAGHHLGLGSEAAAERNIAVAYQRFQQAREIQRLMGGDIVGTAPEELALRSLLEEAHRGAVEINRHGLGWGYLQVIQRMFPVDPPLKRSLRESREEVLLRAIKRINISPFETSDAESSEFGDAVASKIVQHLFEAIPNDVRVIERKQIEAILREKEFERASEGGEQLNLSAADYLVEGTVTEAKVDSIEKKGRKTMRVTTERIEENNPDHDDWLRLTASERELIPEPPTMTFSERREDISMEVTIHRKVGLFSASVRVIDTSTAKVIFVDSVRDKAEYQDTSEEGIELGEFKQEFKLANLPSDGEILAELADRASTEIGEKLVTVLEDPEDEYLEIARRHFEEENYEAAAEHFSYAIVLSESKNEETAELLLELMNSSIANESR